MRLISKRQYWDLLGYRLFSISGSKRPYDPGQFFKEHFFGYEPFYFVAGTESPNSKFQISLRYQILNTQGPLAQEIPAARLFWLPRIFQTSSRSPAANRGAHDAGAKSVGLNIVLPHEQRPNPYVTPELCFRFRYFAIRKMHFLMRAKALVAFPGGYGTFDELFETLTLIQTGKVPAVPVVLVGREFWERAIGFDALAEEGVISTRDLALFSYAETAREAWETISRFHAGTDHRMPEI